MNTVPCEEPIVRRPFLLPFRGGEIWALEADGLGDHTGLAMEKFNRDIPYAWRPSTTSRVVHLKDTRLTGELIAAIAEGLHSGRGNIQKVAFIGVQPAEKHAFSGALSRKTTGIAVRFFDDYEKGKEWQLP